MLHRSQKHFLNFSEREVHMSSSQPSQTSPPAAPVGPLGMTPLDLSSPIPGYDVKIERSESPEEHKERLRAEGRSSLIKDGMWIGLLLLLVILILVFLWVLFFKANASPEEKDLSSKILLSLVTGTISFVLGRATGK